MWPFKKFYVPEQTHYWIELFCNNCKKNYPVEIERGVSVDTHLKGYKCICCKVNAGFEVIKEKKNESTSPFIYDPID